MTVKEQGTRTWGVNTGADERIDIIMLHLPHLKLNTYIGNKQ